MVRKTRAADAHQWVIPKYTHSAVATAITCTPRKVFLYWSHIVLSSPSSPQSQSNRVVRVLFAITDERDSTCRWLPGDFWPEIRCNSARFLADCERSLMGLCFRRETAG